ncbi:acetolactate synthase [Thalassoroseus pseudoceratinae]|uniref:acetolactate synthase n=1 Tax=Thalassoroseus pseudoceratinae TaxID=2713176 RepID=UPI001F1102AD|nr:acetolactate synthase [Thalassoroseus pseudoceratinae]
MAEFYDDEEDSGSGIVTEAGTMRGRDWPCLRQFGVFLENRVGSLNDLMRHLERQDLRIMALSIADSIDCCVVRLMLNHYERGRELLELSEFTVFETDVIGVQLPNVAQPYVQVCSALLRAEVSIHYSYPLLYRRGGQGAIAMYVDDIDLGLKILNQNGLRVITEKDLLEDDEDVI